MKIHFVGDIFLGGELSQKPAFDLVQSDIFAEADMVIGNLEGPISGLVRRTEKSALVASDSAPEQLRQLGVFAVGLANNHLHDGGDEGILRTFEKLNDAGISSFGAGLDISAASEPLWLEGGLGVLGYCDLDKPHLWQVQAASDRGPGINPLTFNKVLSDLERLPLGARVILFFHWGREHVWLPPPEDLKLARTLLQDDRVLGVIGMHCHRVQGVVRNGRKKAYMSLGNFIFPDFHIAPRNKLVNLTETEKREVKYRTSSYHTVFHVTRKCWPLINRVSLVIAFDTEALEFSEQWVIQDAESGKVANLRGVLYVIFKLLFGLQSTILKLPDVLYEILIRPYYFQSKVKRNLKIRAIQLGQLGIYNFVLKILNNVKNK